ncbi:MAG: phosphodiester glycosidase family protein [Gammaproteobacteria bacterium]|nr:phosphodiester glycosidase family protein [Gammaproteobacteria bacterium]
MKLYQLKYMTCYLTISFLAACGSSDTKQEEKAVENETTNNELLWEENSAELSLPDGLRSFIGKKGNSELYYYLEVDLTSDTIELRAIKSDTSQTITKYIEKRGVLAAINGGYFSGNTSYSALLDNSTYFAKNIAVLTRFSNSYPVIRSGFTLNQENNADINWIYQFDNSGEVYVYSQPLQYVLNDGTPMASPVKSDGILTSPKLVVGGGPTLVKSGEAELTYEQEVFWGSGVELNDFRPRSAVCVTADDKVIMFIAKSQQLSALPDILIQLGCDDAMNLDGGGSSAIAVDSKVIYTQGRAVPTALLVVDKSSFQP